MGWGERSVPRGRTANGGRRDPCSVTSGLVTCLLLRRGTVQSPCGARGAGTGAAARSSGRAGEPRVAGNPIVTENSSPESGERVGHRRRRRREHSGFATDISVNQGQTVHFKIETDASDYRLDIYRMGYYGGIGARKIATVTPSASLPQTSPPA